MQDCLPHAAALITNVGQPVESWLQPASWAAFFIFFIFFTASQGAVPDSAIQNLAVNPIRTARGKPGEMFVLLSALT
jgi:hypothetical protein